MKYFLDTNIISYYLKASHPLVRTRFAAVDREEIFIPTIVVAEIEYGARHSFDYDKTMAIYKPFLETFNIIDFDKKAAFEYGLLREELTKDGNLIGPNDLQIAAIVIANDGILITHNVGEFARVKNLKIQDWTV